MQTKEPHNEKINILIVGAGKAGELVAEDIAHNKETAFQIVGFIDDDHTKLGKNVKGFPVLGAIDDIKDIAPTNNIEELLITIPSERGKVIRRIIESTV